MHGLQHCHHKLTQGIRGLRSTQQTDRRPRPTRAGKVSGVLQLRLSNERAIAARNARRQQRERLAIHKPLVVVAARVGEPGHDVACLLHRCVDREAGRRERVGGAGGCGVVAVLRRPHWRRRGGERGGRLASGGGCGGGGGSAHRCRHVTDGGVRGCRDCKGGLTRWRESGYARLTQGESSVVQLLAHDHS
jgi:hypothetical protein